MSRCHVGRLLASLDSDTAVLLEQALSMSVERVGHKRLRNLLTAHKSEFEDEPVPSTRVIRRHRSKECSCKQ